VKTNMQTWWSKMTCCAWCVIVVIRKLSDASGKNLLIEKKLASKEDLKMTDLLRYYTDDGQAAKDLLYRRIKVCQSFSMYGKPSSWPREREFLQNASHCLVDMELKWDPNVRV
jgi:hypothetical protein